MLEGSGNYSQYRLAQLCGLLGIPGPQFKTPFEIGICLSIALSKLSLVHKCPYADFALTVIQVLEKM